MIFTGGRPERERAARVKITISRGTIDCGDGPLRSEWLIAQQFAGDDKLLNLGGALVNA